MAHELTSRSMENTRLYRIGPGIEITVISFMIQILIEKNTLLENTIGTMAEPSGKNTHLDPDIILYEEFQIVEKT